MRSVRLLLIVAGVCAGLYGGWRLLDEPEALVSVATWIVGPVLVHDLLLAPIIVSLGWAGAQVLRPSLRAPLLTGALATGGLTLIALPLLRRPGARADNSSLLDRDYVTGWLMAIGVVWLVVAIWVVLVATASAPRRAP